MLIELNVIVEFGSSGCKLCFYNGTKNVTDIGKDGNILHIFNTTTKEPEYRHAFDFDTKGDIIISDIEKYSGHFKISEINPSINNTRSSSLEKYLESVSKHYTIGNYTILISGGHLGAIYKKTFKAFLKDESSEKDESSQNITDDLSLKNTNNLINKISRSKIFNKDKYIKTQDRLIKETDNGLFLTNILTEENLKQYKIEAQKHEAKAEAFSYKSQGEKDFQHSNGALTIFMGGSTTQIGVLNLKNGKYSTEDELLIDNTDFATKDLSTLTNNIEDKIKYTIKSDGKKKINVLLAANINFILNHIYNIHTQQDFYGLNTSKSPDSLIGDVKHKNYDEFKDLRDLKEILDPNTLILFGLDQKFEDSEKLKETIKGNKKPIKPLDISLFLNDVKQKLDSQLNSGIITKYKGTGGNAKSDAQVNALLKIVEVLIKINEDDECNIELVSRKVGEDKAKIGVAAGVSQLILDKIPGEYDNVIEFLIAVKQKKVNCENINFFIIKGDIDNNKETNIDVTFFSKDKSKICRIKTINNYVEAVYLLLEMEKSQTSKRTKIPYVVVYSCAFLIKEHSVKKKNITKESPYQQFVSIEPAKKNFIKRYIKPELNSIVKITKENENSKLEEISEYNPKLTQNIEIINFCIEKNKSNNFNLNHIQELFPKIDECNSSEQDNKKYSKSYIKYMCQIEGLIQYRSYLKKYKELSDNNNILIIGDENYIKVITNYELASNTDATLVDILNTETYNNIYYDPFISNKIKSLKIEHFINKGMKNLKETQLNLKEEEDAKKVNIMTNEANVSSNSIP